MAILDSIPSGVTLTFAAIGLSYLSYKVLQYVVLLLELFVIKGTNVCLPLSFPLAAPYTRVISPRNHLNSSSIALQLVHDIAQTTSSERFPTDNSIATKVRPQRNMGPYNWCLRRLRQRVQHPTSSQRLQSPPSLSNCLETRHPLRRTRTQVQRQDEDVSHGFLSKPRL